MYKNQKVPLPKARIELAASKDDAKPKLNSVYYDADNKCWVAADGFIMAIHPIENGGDTPVIVPTRFVTLERKAAKKRTPTVVIDDDSACMYHADAVLPQNSEKYPGYQNVVKSVPKHRDPETITLGLDVQKLYTLARALESRKSKEDALQMKITVKVGYRIDGSLRQTDTPITVRQAYTDNGPTGIIMPLVGD